MTAVAGLVHAALLHDSAEELAAAAVPFLADGLAAGQPAVLACSEDHNALLARALGDDDRILLLSHEDIYAGTDHTGTAHALATYRRMLHRQVAAGVPGIRLVGALPLDQRPRWGQWHRYEAVFNVAMGRMPLASVCAYDRREISDAMRDGVEETHPALLTPAGLVPNDRYVEPATVLRRTATVQGNPVPEGPPTLVLADLTDPARLPELRVRVRAALDGAGAQEARHGRFAAAVTEVLGNAFRHGAPPVAVRLWITPARLEATVTDCGEGFDDPLAGFVPPFTSSSLAGAGLWVARQACDTLATFRTPSGFTVRLTTVLRGPGPAGRPTGPATADSATGRAERARADARELARRLQA
ncbi:anti-sigma factor RsbA family regulatory protein [Geodermatophilus sp. SYSU D00684]